MEEVKQFYQTYKQLFPPVNSKPTQLERDLMFKMANLVNPTGNHKPSSCGRCYYNARAAVIKALKNL